MKECHKKYEDAARSVLYALRGELNLSQIETKQSLPGNSGTTWEIDAKAWCEGNNGFLVVEARRYTTRRLNQESVAAVAFRIQDLGAVGGIIVSPLKLQKGGQLVAASANIEHVVLSADSTPERYLAEYMERIYHGLQIIDSAQTGGGAVISGNLSSHRKST